MVKRKMFPKRRTGMTNKGFSLVEVIIAVAVLTILMAPIIQQIIQTLSTSAKAKERQYATENAEYVLNYFQETSLTSLLNFASSGKVGSSVTTTTGGGVLTASIDGKLNFTSVNTTSHTCYAYVCGNYATIEDYLGRTAASSTDISGGHAGAVGYPYTVITYTLDNAELGKQKNPYTRKVTLDNLKAKLSEDHLSIETNFSGEAITTLKGMGFTITDEGFAVKYASGTSGPISEIWVSKVDAMQSPNGVGTSYMQDLDSSKVAIIQGAASNFDLQAENDLYNLKMNRLKEENYLAWQQAMSSQTGQNVLKTNAYLDNVNKMTKITIVSGEETDGADTKKFYDVNCTVYYEDYLTKTETGTTSSIPELLSYNAYSRRFYTSQAPDIYLFYEPYVADGTNYARSDYILTYDGVDYGTNEKHSKLYIIKPSSCRIGGYATQTRTFRTKMKNNSSTGVPVQIYVDYIKNNSCDNQPMPIYTNIDIEENYSILNTIAENNVNGVQYSGNLDTYYSVKQSGWDGTEAGETIIHYGADLNRVNYPAKILYSGKEIDSIQDISKDVMLSDRVYTVTVEMDKLNKDTMAVETGYSVHLTGAKGAD